MIKNKKIFLFIIPFLIFIINSNVLFYENYLFVKPIFDLTHLEDINYELYFDNNTIIGYEKVFSQKDINSFIYCSFYDFESSIFENYDENKVLIIGELDNKNNNGKTNNKTNYVDFDFTDFSSYLMHNKFCISKNYLITGSTNPTYNGIYKNNNNLILFYFNNSNSFKIKDLLRISDFNINVTVNNSSNVISNNNNENNGNNNNNNNNNNSKDDKDNINNKNYSINNNDNYDDINVNNSYNYSIINKIKIKINYIMNLNIQPVTKIQFLYIKNFIYTIKNQSCDNEIKKISYKNMNITPCFSPFDDCQDLIIKEIKEYNDYFNNNINYDLNNNINNNYDDINEITNVLAFSFTDKNIFYNLDYANIVIERSNRNAYTIDKFDLKKVVFLNEKLEPKINIYNDNNKYKMHNKVFIFKDSIITGSYNPTGNAQKNHENILVIENENIVKEFEKYFESIFEDSEMIN